MALINLRILCVTQGRQCLGLICFCGINSCIAFNRVVLKIVHCVFTEVCSVELCMSSRRIEGFDFIAILGASIPSIRRSTSTRVAEVAHYHIQIHLFGHIADPGDLC